MPRLICSDVVVFGSLDAKDAITDERESHGIHGIHRKTPKGGNNNIRTWPATVVRASQKELVGVDESKKSSKLVES